MIAPCGKVFDDEIILLAKQAQNEPDKLLHTFPIFENIDLSVPTNRLFDYPSLMITFTFQSSCLCSMYHNRTMDHDRFGGGLYILSPWYAPLQLFGEFPLKLEIGVEIF